MKHLGVGMMKTIDKERAMRKVLILSASPRKGGNSDILCHQFMNGAVEAGNKVELISLYNLIG